MGRDKAGLLLDGQTLLQTVSETMRAVFPQVLVSVRQRRADTGFPQVCDAVPDGGPLAGLASALELAATPWVFVVACDMPFITAAVVELLARQRGDYQAVVPEVAGQLQPLAAFYARSCLPAARAILAGDGRHSMHALLEQVKVCHVGEEQLRGADTQLRSFFDLDTPQDVVAALRGVK